MGQTPGTLNRSARVDRTTFQQSLSSTAFTFRGYNVTNLGRTGELLQHAAYGPILRESLESAAEMASDILGRGVNLIERVESNRETSLECYDEAIALIIGVEHGQLRMLEELHEIPPEEASCFCGYSLGEIAALVESGAIDMYDALNVPLSLAADSVALANDVTLGVLFSLGDELPRDVIDEVCLEISARGKGVIGPSAELSPNSTLLMGQGGTLDELKRMVRERVEKRVHLRRNEHQWPPLHTPIVWQRHIPDKASLLMQTMKRTAVPTPDVISLVTGGADYTTNNLRDLLRRWTDHRQELWKVIIALLDRDVRTVVHVGPTPNIIPATFKRLTENIESQTQGSLGTRVLSQITRRPWLKSLLPRRTMLLNTLQMQHIVLEDWLLENEPE